MSTSVQSSASSSAASTLYKLWTVDHSSLGGPTDFHTLQHYLDLYVLALHPKNEELQNDVMDLTRTYYRAEKLTAPAFRLEHIYSATHEPNIMRTFLVQTTAFRILCEQPEDDTQLISASLRGVLLKNSEMAVDFAEAALELGRKGTADPRRGSDCD